MRVAGGHFVVSGGWLPARAWIGATLTEIAYAILEERNNDPQWQVPYFSLNPIRNLDFFDPYDPDYPPMPPDDPAAYEYMLRANGMRNYRRWHKTGMRPRWRIRLGELGCR